MDPFKISCLCGRVCTAKRQKVIAFISHNIYGQLGNKTRRAFEGVSLELCFPLVVLYAVGTSLVPSNASIFLFL